jgi:hypothetical protein
MGSARGESKTIALLERRQRALGYRKAGLTYPAIVDKIRVEFDLPKYSRQLAHKDVSALLKEFRRELGETTEEVRSLEISRLDSYLSTIWAAIGKGDTRAIAAAIRISERRARLLGLDAPVEVKIQAEAAAIATNEFALLLSRLADRPDFPRASLDILLEEGEALGDRAAVAGAN